MIFLQRNGNLVKDKVNGFRYFNSSQDLVESSLEVLLFFFLTSQSLPLYI